MIPHRKAIRPARRALLALLAVLLAFPPGKGRAGEPAPGVLHATLAAGSDGLPAGWRHIAFPRIDRATRYEAVEEAGRSVLRAHADRSASLLVWEQEFDPREFPLLTWEWKLGATLAGADLRHKATDDAAARVLVLFPAEPGDGPSGGSWWRRFYRTVYGDDLPTRGLAYVAAPALSTQDAEVTHEMPARPRKVGKHAAGDELWLPSAYTRHMMLLPLLPPPPPAPTPSSPPAPLLPRKGRGEGEGGTSGAWQRFRRDLAADYPAAFGKPLPARARLAVMVDTDNTQQETVSAFAALQVARR